MNRKKPHIIDIAWIFLVVGCLSSSTSIALMIWSETFEYVGYCVFLLVSLIVILIGIKEEIRVIKKRRVISKILPSYLKFIDFNEALLAIIDEDDPLKYNELFLKTEDKNTPLALIGTDVLKALKFLNYDAEECFYIWYDNPRQVKLFVDSFDYSFKELKMIDKTYDV